jgi:hypothetical protein
MAAVHPWIAKHNWLFFREGDDLDAAFLDLFKALDTDIDYVRTAHPPASAIAGMAPSRARSQLFTPRHQPQRGSPVAHPRRQP